MEKTEEQDLGAPERRRVAACQRAWAWYAANHDRVRAARRSDVHRAYRRQWRATHPEKSRAYRLASRDKASAQHKEWYLKNREKQLAARKKYRAEHPEIRSAYRTKKRRSDPDFHLMECLRGRLFKAVRGMSKSARTQELLGCTIPQLRAHLESQFRPGMTWENYGPVWHVDHIKPVASFDLIDPVQQRECFNFKNLQPLFAKDNLQKGAR